MEDRKGETHEALSLGKTRRALEVVFMWMAANVYDAGKNYASQVETLSKVAQICKVSSIIINPRLEAFYPMIKIYKAAVREAAHKERMEDIVARFHRDMRQREVELEMRLREIARARDVRLSQIQMDYLMRLREIADERIVRQVEDEGN